MCLLLILLASLLKFTAMQILPTLRRFWKLWVHNILEPATFGVPIIGPNYSHFAEATVLVKLEGCTPSDTEQLKKSIDDMISDEVYRSEKDTGTFVTMNKGATNIILKSITNNN
jgi:3-deoxy-D-manno-octulosonic-acid transferase